MKCPLPQLKTVLKIPADGSLCRHWLLANLGIVASLWCVWAGKQEKGTKLDHLIQVLKILYENCHLQYQSSTWCGSTAAFNIRKHFDTNESSNILGIGYMVPTNVQRNICCKLIWKQEFWYISVSIMDLLGPGKILDSSAALVKTESWTPKLGLFSYCGRVEQAFDIKQRWNKQFCKNSFHSSSARATQLSPMSLYWRPTKERGQFESKVT